MFKPHITPARRKPDWLDAPRNERPHVRYADKDRTSAAASTNRTKRHSSPRNIHPSWDWEF